jgi:hypothetical protein
MAQGRMLKRKIVQSRELASCSVLARLLFIYGMVHADIDGRYYGESIIWRSQLLPWDDITAEDISAAMDELAAAKDSDNVPLVHFYHFRGTRYCYFPGFADNQTLRPDRESPSDLPPPEDSGSAPADVPPEDSGSTPGTKEVKVKVIEEKLIEGKVTPTDKQILTIWLSVPGFKAKITMPKAQELLAKLREEFPYLNLEEVSRQWVAYKIGKPLMANSNPSSQIYNWMANAKKFKEEADESGRTQNRTTDVNQQVDKPGGSVFSDVGRIHSGGADLP